MKYFIKFNKVLLPMVLILTFGSCTKNYEEINTNPNDPTDVPGKNIFTNVVINSVGTELGGWIQHTYLGNWSQQWCKVQYIDEDRYQTRDMTGYFEGPYRGTLMDLQIIIDKAQQDIDDGHEVTNNQTLLAAAKIMRVWIFDYLTDIFGDLPYSEALQGLKKDGITTPKYDTQESIYTSFFNELEEANTLLDLSTATSFGSADLLFNGDPAQWKKFGNSLRLRLLDRVAGTPWSFTYNMVGGGQVTTDAGPAAYANADADIAMILGNSSKYPIMESNADNAKLVYPGIPYRNPIFNALYSRTDQAISETMVNWLLARNDPRLPVYAQTTVASDTSSWPQYYGFQNGSDKASAFFPQISLLGTAIAYDENAPLYILTYDEIEFIIAEYQMRNNQDAAARTAYEAGITASMDRWGADVGTYLSDPAVDWSTAATPGEKYQRICEQRWAAIFGQGVQAYNLVRRTGFPERIFEYELAGTNYPGLGLPVRITYSLNEEVYNTMNLQEAKTRQNVETSNEGMFSTSGTSSQLWWHTRKNPIPTVTDPQ
ncbi:MAG: SusD/RagB family nutrient-binding outer membrane lipoprotein [Chlorobi bacterium]|nr:SusD/RagB family nutrient-binding outer membrane lipoprotein [Chlorobiota bacterium]